MSEESERGLVQHKGKLVETAAVARSEYRTKQGIDTSDEPEERLTVVISNSLYSDPDEWLPVSLHETESEARYVANRLRDGGHGAETRTLPLYRELPGEHTGTTNIGDAGG